MDILYETWQLANVGLHLTYMQILYTRNINFLVDFTKLSNILADLRTVCFVYPFRR